MKHNLLEVVVLVRDLPDHGLRKDDLGTVVELYAPDQVEVEFVNAAGHTSAPGASRTRLAAPVINVLAWASAGVLLPERSSCPIRSRSMTKYSRSHAPAPSSPRPLA